MAAAAAARRVMSARSVAWYVPSPVPAAAALS
jgi:hypothetical protein